MMTSRHYQRLLPSRISCADNNWLVGNSSFDNLSTGSRSLSGTLSQYNSTCCSWIAGRRGSKPTGRRRHSKHFPRCCDQILTIKKVKIYHYIKAKNISLLEILKGLNSAIFLFLNFLLKNITKMKIFPYFPCYSFFLLIILCIDKIIIIDCLLKNSVNIDTIIRYPSDTFRSKCTVDSCFTLWHYNTNVRCCTKSPSTWTCDVKYYWLKFYVTIQKEIRGMNNGWSLFVEFKVEINFSESYCNLTVTILHGKLEGLCMRYTYE